MFQKRAIFINTASQVLVRFVTLAFTLISIKLLANYLGTAGVGNYNTITTYINFFIVIADLGLFSVAVREISKKPEDEKKILANVFFIRLITATIASLIAIFIVLFTKYSHDIKLGTMIATLFLLFNLASSAYDMALQYRLKMQYSALAEFLSKLITLAALYVIIRMQGSFLWITATIALSGILIFIFKWLFSVKFIKVWPEYDRKIAKWIFDMAWPLGIVFIANNLYFKLDTLMLFVIKGSVDVGIYSVAYKVLEVTVFIAAYFSSALKPTISKEIHSDKTALAGVIEKSFLVLFLAAAPISIICITFSRNIILFLSNMEFISGANALIVLALTLPFIYLVMLLSEILIANDSRSLLIKISAVILLFNFIANLVAIPLYSFMGAAFTTLLSEIILFGIMIHYTKKIVPFSTSFSLAAKPILLFVLTLLSAFFIRQITNINFFILIAFVIGIYFLWTYLLGIVQIKTISNLLKGKE
jgi:O-antigen/teichoic acid export membrane protein